MDIRKVKKLIELLEESGLSELEITEGEESIRISRSTTSTAVQYTLPPQPLPAAPAAGPAAQARFADRRCVNFGICPILKNFRR